MKPPAFEYLAPSTLEQAVAALGAEDAKILAGGQSLLPMLNFRLLAPSLLLDINRIPGLDHIDDWDSGLRIGALTRHHALETSPLVRDRFPVLHAAMAEVAHLAIRNRGTIGGSLCHGDPAAELPGMAVLLEAQLQTTQRTIPAAEFYDGTLSTILAADEILTDILLPALPSGTGWGFEEFARRSGDFALAAVGVLIGAEVRIVAMGANEIPIRLAKAEALFNGPSDIDGVAEAAGAEVSPESDLHGSADYRRHLVKVLTRRALRAAWERTS